jgi:4'-phosphopantetheinyl transferase
VLIRSIALTVADDELVRCRAILNDEERARADRFRFEKHTRRFTVARAFLRTILGEVTDRAPAAVEITLSPYGKPLVEGVEFNLSHSSELAVVAVAESRVGIDVERVRERPTMEMAERFFAPDEVEQLRSAPPDERQHAFFRCWTSKEAYLKARGEGITLPLDWFVVSLDRDTPALLRARDDDPSRWRLSRVPVAEGYVCTVAVERSASESRR